MYVWGAMLQRLKSLKENSIIKNCAYLVMIIGAITLSCCNFDNNSKIKISENDALVLSEKDSAYYNKAALRFYLHNFMKTLPHDSCNYDSINIFRHDIKLNLFYDTIHPKLDHKVKLFQFSFYYEHENGQICTVGSKKSAYYFKDDNMDSLFLQLSGFSDSNPLNDVSITFRISDKKLDSAYTEYFKKGIDTIGADFYNILLANHTKYLGPVNRK